MPAGDLPTLINRFLDADTWDESQQIVEAHPELLGGEVDERFALALEEYADNPDAVAMLAYSVYAHPLAAVATGVPEAVKG